MTAVPHAHPQWIPRRRVRALERAGRRPTRHRHLTAALGIFSGTSVAVLFGAELVRVWRLGSLPVTRSGIEQTPLRKRSPTDILKIVREGYSVSSTRQNSIVNMTASFIFCLGVTRFITSTIHARGHLGPIRDLRSASGRHIHHFIPGGLISLVAGGISIASNRQDLDRWLAIPFGIGTALVLDESALLLELEDVYWSEEGALSLQIVFAVVSLLAALAYALQVARRGEPGAEADWKRAARAFDDVSLLQGRG